MKSVHFGVFRSVLNRRKVITEPTISLINQRRNRSNINIHQYFMRFWQNWTFSASPNYIVDAIDTVTGKLALVEQAQRAGVPIISSMGAGNKMDPTAFEVADIYETSVCPLARVMRRELKKRGIQKLKVVYSKEQPMTPIDDMTISCRTHCICPPGTARKCTQRRQVPGSNAFVPSVAGLIIAGEVVRDLSGFPPNQP